MTSQNANPESLSFDEAKSFADNCDAFLSSLAILDEDMASILRDHWNVLIAVVREGERDSKARAQFNAEVASALDSMAKLTESNGRT